MAPDANADDPRPVLFHPPRSVLASLEGWGAPLLVDSNSAAAHWLAGCDQEPAEPQGCGGHWLTAGPTPPRAQGAALETQGASIHDLGDGLVLSLPHPDAAHRTLWWPVVLTPQPAPTRVAGYTLAWQGTRLWASEDDLTITDSEGGDVPPGIFARRTGPDTLRQAFAQRHHTLLNGLQRFAHTQPVPPTCINGVLHAHSPWARQHIWEPWRPQRNPPTLPADLDTALQRFARVLAPQGRIAEQTRIGLRGGYPQQDGRLSPLTLVWSTPLWGTGSTEPVPSQAALDRALACIQKAGLLGFLERHPWVSSPLDTAGASTRAPEGTVGAHTRLADTAWAMGIGWEPA
jgi:hypothetical protein